jgi:Cu-Zn family superoxide dismutase
MRSFAVMLGIGLALAIGGGAVGAEGERAGGALMNGAGQQVGTARLEQVAGGVRVSVAASGLTPGQHGIHVHAVGRCEGPAFTSAGGHFNPAGKKHGLKSPDGAHGGDLPNLTVDAAGTASYTATTSLFTLPAGATSLFDADGAALVIHAMPDDETTDPTGNSGDRVVCAVLSMSAAMPRTGAGGLAEPPIPLVATGGALALTLAGLALARRRRAA